jgi:hypothetical protein
MLYFFEEYFYIGILRNASIKSSYPGKTGQNQFVGSKLEPGLIFGTRTRMKNLSLLHMNTISIDQQMILLKRPCILTIGLCMSFNH